MEQSFYTQLAQDSINGTILSQEISMQILKSEDIELLPLLHAAYQVRKQFVGNDVLIHILNNAQNGYCPEDCHYCAQSKSSDAKIDEYPLKSDKQILKEAQEAYKRGAHRYCMVFAGTGPSKKRVDHLVNLIKTIKAEFKMEVCVSAGVIDDDDASKLKDAGLNRLNHNLNTSKNHYSKICTTHTYEDRIKTLRSAQRAGLQLCSGVIIGMGESPEDVVEMCLTAREMNINSIPVNFFMPIKGTALKNYSILSPEFCLRVLCLYRLINPKTEIRIAAGREMHLKSMEVMALYPANSLFIDGYLNTSGEARKQTFEMIKDAGFSIKSEYSLDELIKNEVRESSHGKE